jgi:hypothetical protein
MLATPVPGARPALTRGYSNDSGHSPVNSGRNIAHPDPHRKPPGYIFAPPQPVPGSTTIPRNSRAIGDRACMVTYGGMMYSNCPMFRIGLLGSGQSGLARPGIRIARRPVARPVRAPGAPEIPVRVPFSVVELSHPWPTSAGSVNRLRAIPVFASPGPGK